MFFCHFTKENNFCDFLFAAMDNKALPKRFMNRPHFLGYKTELFSFKNNPKDLDASYKMDLDLWDSLGKVILVL